MRGKEQTSTKTKTGGLSCMYRYKKLAPIAAAVTFLLSAGLSATQALAGAVIIPESSVDKPGAPGSRAHTNIEIFVPEQVLSGPAAAHANSLGSLLMKEDPYQIEPLAPPFPGFLFETPASLGCIYKLTPATGCNPNVVTAVPTGGSRTIAIVDADDQPNALSDLQEFSTQFGLTSVSAANFTVVFANGTRPPTDPTGGAEIV
jgi:hypothetical protein